MCISISDIHVNSAPTAVTPVINHTPMETFFVAKFPTTTMSAIESICNKREHQLQLNLSSLVTMRPAFILEEQVFWKENLYRTPNRVCGSQTRVGYRVASQDSCQVDLPRGNDSLTDCKIRRKRAEGKRD